MIRSMYDIRLPSVDPRAVTNAKIRWSHETPPLDLCPVTQADSRGLRRAVYTLATYFRREFGYDFVQWDVDASEHPSANAFLWHDRDWNRAFGCACFRWQPARWSLDWIWFHPYERGKGHLTRAWPYFRERFGDFCIMPPVSPAMAAFLLTVRGRRELDF